MKTLFLTFLTYLLSQAMIAQPMGDKNSWTLNNEGHIFRDYSVSLSPNILYHSYNKTQMAAGLKGRIFLTKRISIEADFIFGNDYIHYGPGIIGLPILAGLLFTRDWDEYDDDYNNDWGSDNTLVEVLAGIGLVLLSIEHTAYHIPVNTKTELSPYISFLRFRTTPEAHYLEIDSEVLRSTEASFALGLELNVYTSRFIISPYIEYNKTYHGNISGFFAGVYCGIYFPGRE